MGRFNTYQSDLKYTPDSFDKMAMLPMEMRRKHDQITSDQSILEINRRQASVSKPFQDQANSINKELDRKSADLASRLSKQGTSDPSIMAEFVQLRNEQNGHVSKTGGLGKGMADLASMDKAKLDYYQSGAKANQSAERIKKNWEKEESQRFSTVSEMLKDNPNANIDGFMPGQVPNSIDPIAVTGELRRIMGQTESQVFKEGIVLDPLSGEFVLSKDTTKTINNKDQLIKYAQYMNTYLMDDNSEVVRDLKYKSDSPEQFLKNKALFMQRVEYLAGIIRSDSEIKTNEKTTPKTTETTTADNKDSSSLMPTNQNSADLTAKEDWLDDGESVELNHANSGRIIAKMNKIESTPSLAAKYANSTNFSIIKERLIALNIEREGIERKNPNYKSEQYAIQMKKASWVDNLFGTDDYLGPNRVITLGEDGKLKRESAYTTPKTYKEFEKSINGSIKSINDYLEQWNSTASDVDIRTAKKQLVALEKRKDQVDSNLLANISGGRNPKLQVDNYVFKSDQVSQDTKKRMEGFTANVLDNLLVEGLSTGATAYSFDGADIKKGTIEELQSKGTPKSITIGSITSKGMNGFPGMNLKINYGTEAEPDERHVQLYLNDTEEKANVLREVFNDIYGKTNDPETKAIIGSMLDNSRAIKMVPDSIRDSGRIGFSDVQNRQILNIADTSGYKNQVVNSDGKHEYQLVQDERGYHGINIAEKGKKEFKLYSVNDMVHDREMTGSSQMKIDSNKVSQVASIVLMMRMGTGGRDFGTGVLRPSANNGGNQKMVAAIKEYEAQFKEGITPAAQLIITNNFLTQAGEVGIMSRSKTMFVGGRR